VEINFKPVIVAGINAEHQSLEVHFLLKPNA